MDELKVFEELTGVGPATIEKLEESDYTTLASIAVASKSELVDTTGLPSSLAAKVINFAREKANMNFVTGSELMKKKDEVEVIEIGSETINELLGGGFQTGSIYEAFGEFGSGKTQLAHELVVSSQKLAEDAKIVYIDTESTFRPNRVESIAKEKGYDPEKVLENTFVARSYNTDHQMLLADKVNDMITKDNENIKLVIVDSLTGHFRAEF
ncbi:MAG: helix-hairpin-helix domain-containing protein, partial [Candidatus Woesearchaeota archaeon]